MMIRYFKVFVIILLSMSFLALSVLILNKYRADKTNIRDGKTPEENIFSRQYDVDSAKNILDQAVLDKYQNDPEGLKMFRLGFGIDELDPSTPWDYKNVTFLAIVSDIDQAELTLKLKFISPETMPFLGQEKTVVADDTTCPDPIYMVVSGEDKIWWGPIDLYSMLAQRKEHEEEVVFQSFCMDENCSTIGRLCKITSEYW